MKTQAKTSLQASSKKQNQKQFRELISQVKYLTYTSCLKQPTSRASYAADFDSATVRTCQIVGHDFSTYIQSHIKPRVQWHYCGCYYTYHLVTGQHYVRKTAHNLFGHLPPVLHCSLYASCQPAPGLVTVRQGSQIVLARPIVPRYLAAVHFVLPPCSWG